MSDDAEDCRRIVAQRTGSLALAFYLPGNPLETLMRP